MEKKNQKLKKRNSDPTSHSPKVVPHSHLGLKRPGPDSCPPLPIPHPSPACSKELAELEVTDGPLLACVPAPCSQMERRLLASPPPREPPRPPPPSSRVRGSWSSKLLILHWSVSHLSIWGERSRGPRTPLWSGLGFHPASLCWRGEGLVCPAWGRGNIRVALEFEASPPPQKRNVVSDKGFEVNKVLKASPVVHPYWGFPLQLVWV